MKIITEYKVSKFFGNITEQKDLKEIPDGYSPDSLNWIPENEMRGVELRRGTALLGTTRNIASGGKITGLGVGSLFNGTQVPFFTHGREIEYYNADEDDRRPVSVADSETILDSYTEDNYSDDLVFSTTWVRGGQIFTPSGDAYLTTVKFYLDEITPSAGTIYAKLYAAEDGLPTGSALATSDAFDVATLTGTMSLHSFVFSGANQYLLRNAHSYAIELVRDETVTGTIHFGADQSDPSHGGNSYYFNVSGVATADTPTDKIFYVYGKLAGVVLPEAADGETVSISPYQNIAGTFAFFSSPNSSIYKVHTANPADIVDQQSTTYRGFFKFGQSRGFLFNRHGATAGNKDQMGLYTSKVDKVDLSQYPAQVTGESVGSSGSTEYSHTLTQITGKRTAMFLTVSATVAAGTETFTDDRNGALVSNFGGTGTVNYATGEIEVTFSAVTTGAVTAAYYYEDSTSGGVCDFAIADPSDRVAGEGNYFPQFDGGGTLNSVFPLATVFYCFHDLKTWQVSIPVDDESGTDSISTNLPFREKMGVKSPYGAYGGEQGIYLISTADRQKADFKRLELYTGATSANIAKPTSLSKKLIDFSGYAFDHAVVHEWGDYVLLCCQQIRNGVADDYNSRMFMYNKNNKTWAILDNPSSCLAEYDGTLIGGDPLTNNVFTLFSGFDDDNSLIPNYYTEGDKDFGIPGQKRFTRMKFEGLIQVSQRIEIKLSFDGASPVTVFTIEGTGSYVNTGKSIAVGSYTVGSKVSGGGEVIYAHPFSVEFKVQSPRFEYVRPQWVALSGGYVLIGSYAFRDIRQKSGRTLPERTA